MTIVADRANIRLADVATSVWRDFLSWEQARDPALPFSALGSAAGEMVRSAPTPAYDTTLLKLAWQVSLLLTRYDASKHAENRDELSGDLVAALRLLVRAADQAVVTLESAARHNLAKIADRWPDPGQRTAPALFDDAYPIEERLPWLLEIEVFERDVGEPPRPAAAVSGRTSALRRAAAMMTPGAFLADLAGVRLDGVFNPYSDRCPDHYPAGSPRCRRGNLEAVLAAAWAAKGGAVWVARDLGYLGGRRTGLPLTDKIYLRHFSEAWGRLSLRKATTGLEVGERTAAVICDMLCRVGRPVFLLNLFPRHPQDEGNPMSNRSHKAAERPIGEWFLTSLLEAVQLATVVAIGNDAATAPQRFGCGHAKVRHPSYRGQASFCAGIAAIDDALP